MEVLGRWAFLMVELPLTGWGLRSHAEEASAEERPGEATLLFVLIWSVLQF